jgi:hypothetical protein
LSSFQILGLTVISEPSDTTFAHVYGYIGHCKNPIKVLTAFPARVSMILHCIDPPLVIEDRTHAELKDFRCQIVLSSIYA